MNPTTGVTVDDYLPAGLEFLGCAGTPGTTAPGRGVRRLRPDRRHPADHRLRSTRTSSRPSNTDPDGAGPLAPASTPTCAGPTSATFPASGGQEDHVRRRDPDPREHPDLDHRRRHPATTGAQAANLDNNSGPETYDEQPLLNGAIAAGSYQSPISGARAVSDEGTLARTAEDIAIQKSNDKLHPRAGRPDQVDRRPAGLGVPLRRRRVVIRDTVPNGLCPLGTTNLTTQNDASDAECALVAGRLPNQPYSSVAEQSNGTFAIVWDESRYPALARLAPSATRQLTFWTRTRANYQSDFADQHPGALEGTRSPTTSPPRASTGCAARRPTRPAPARAPRSTHDETDGELDFDVSQSGKAADGPSILKQVAATYPASGDCGDLAAADYGKTVPAYGPGDFVCWKLRLAFPMNLDTFSQDVFDILPNTLSYVPGTWKRTATNTVDITDFDDTADGTDGPAQLEDRRRRDRRRHRRRDLRGHPEVDRGLPARPPLG